MDAHEHGRLSRRTVLRSAGVVAVGAAVPAVDLLGAAAADVGITAAGTGQTIPNLREWTPASGSYVFGSSSRVVVDPAYSAQLTTSATTFCADLRALAGVRLTPTYDGVAGVRPGDVVLTLGSPDGQLGNEGYLMTVGASIAIQARTAAGAFYGTRSVLQLLRRSPTIAAGTARDWPRYRERGLLVCNEPKRFSMGFWRERIRELAYLKMNMLWIYIGYRTTPAAEMRAIADFARQYQVTVIPQFNMPGHMDAVLNTPELRHLYLRSDPPGNDRPGSLDLANPAAWSWAEQRVNELIPVVDSPFWHTGADEYMLGGDYRNYPALLRRARELYGPNATEPDLVRGFVNMVRGVVHRHGKTMRVWNDSVDPNAVQRIPTDVLVEHWVEWGRSAVDLLNAGYKLQNSNNHFLYANESTPMNARHIYDGFRVGRFLGSEVSDDHPALLGAKGHVWTWYDTGDEVPIGNNLAAPLASLAQIVWGSAKPAPDYTRFEPMVIRIGRAPGNTQWMGTATQLPGTGFLTADANQQHVFQPAGTVGGVSHWWYVEGGGISSDRWAGGEIIGQPFGYVHGVEQHVFARGTDNSLRHWAWSPGLMGSRPHLDDWGAGPGVVTSEPAGYAIGGQQHMYYRAANGTLTHRIFNRGGTSVGVENWGGELAGRPLAFVHGEEQHVFARGSDGSLRHWWYVPGMATVPARDTWAPAGSVTTDPAGYAIGRQQHVFYRGAHGTLMHRYFTWGGGGVAVENWGGELAGRPLAYVFGQEQHVFARGSDGSLRHWWYVPGMATVPARDAWAPPGTVTSDLAGYAVGDQQHVYYRTAGGTLGHRYWDASARNIAVQDWGGSIPRP